MFNIWVTNRCNLRCDYCYEKAMTTSNQDIQYSAEDLIAFIDRYNIREDVDVNFHGGEPLVRADLVQVFTKAISNAFENCVFSITTNGTIISDDIVQLFYQYFCEISISIDGPKEIHDRHRKDANGRGSFDRVMHTIDILNENGLDNLRFRMTFTPENVRQLSDSVITLYDLGIKGVVPIPDCFSADWTPDLIDVYVEQVKRLKRFQRERKDDEIVIPGSGKKIKGFCRGGFGSYNIDCDGRVYPCTYTVGNRKYCIGDLYTGIDTEKLEELKAMYEAPIPACGDCAAKRYCDSFRCRFINECINGNPFKPVGTICAFLNADLLRL